MLRLILSLLLVIPFKLNAADIKGQQPNVAIDTKGTVRLAYGLLMVREKKFIALPLQITVQLSQNRC